MSDYQTNRLSDHMWDHQCNSHGQYSGTRPLFKLYDNFLLCPSFWKKGGPVLAYMCPNYIMVSAYIMWCGLKRWETIIILSQSCRWQVKSQFTLFTNFANLSNDVPNSTMFTSRRQGNKKWGTSSKMKLIGYVRNSIKLTVRY